MKFFAFIILALALFAAFAQVSRREQRAIRGKLFFFFSFGRSISADVA